MSEVPTTASTANASRTPHGWWPAILCALAGAAVFQFWGNATLGYIKSASLFYWWGVQWFDPRAETEHGPLIVAVAAWLLWRNLRKVERLLPPAGSLRAPPSTLQSPWPPAAAMAAGLALHALGFAAQQARVSIIGLLVFAWGVLRLGGGRRWGRAAVFPLGFLVFAIPFSALDSVGFWLRVWVIQASATLAHAAGIDVLQSGTQLLAPDGRYHYDVAAACSGVRSLVALAALALLVGYLNFRSWSRRLVVFALCFPLVYVGNVARIVSIVFAAQWLGPVWGDRAHEVMGYGVFVIVLGGVLAAVAALARWHPESAPEVCHPLDDKPAGFTSGAGGNDCHLMDDKRAGVVAAAVVAIAVGEVFFLRQLAALPPRGAAGVRLAADGENPVELPAFLGIEWTGRPEKVTPAERDILPPDTGFSRKLYFNHRDPTKRVLVSIVLSGRDRSSIHRPELCLIGQGWTIAGAATRPFAYPGHAAAAFPATVLRVQREVAPPGRNRPPAVAGQPGGRVVVPQLVAYWFVGSDGVVPTHWQRLVHDAWNRVAHARADRWAYVLLQTDAADGEAAALARMQAVLSETLPAFQKVFAKQKP
ncbi:MAG: exosortase-associated EpsI family protein [Verrucomicrobia bacterium]|nr:exosortase-associated EpsI family protein [Verrucomicrobiota bacterium]